MLCCYLAQRNTHTKRMSSRCHFWAMVWSYRGRCAPIYFAAIDIMFAPALISTKVHHYTCAPFFRCWRRSRLGNRLNPVQTIRPIKVENQKPEQSGIVHFRVGVKAFYESNVHAVRELFKKFSTGQKPRYFIDNVAGCAGNLGITGLQP
jgi:hypothetical protein